MGQAGGTTLLTLENVTRIRNLSGHQVCVLDNVSMNVAAAQMTLLIGPSGGGKSTLLRLLNRLEDPDSGQIRFRGRELHAFSAVALRRDIAMMMQKQVMFAGTVLENLQRPFLYRRQDLPSADSSMVAEVLQLSGLGSDLLSRTASSLSIGQQQRVSLARALITSPQVLLLDEPTSALDRPTGDQLARTLLTICREKQVSIIMATHDLRLAEQIADRLVYIESGRVLEQGDAESLLHAPQTAAMQVFLREPEFLTPQGAVSRETADD